MVSGSDDEVSARNVLGEMATRIQQGPHSALGLEPGVSAPEQVRSAFLALTKRYHPARFGRMSPELQRLSNEVFLGIKSAHETLLRASGQSPRPPSAGMPVVLAEASQPTTRPIPTLATPRPGSPAPTTARPAPRQMPSGTRPASASSARSPTPPSGTRPVSPSKTPTPAVGVPIRPALPRTLTPNAPITQNIPTIPIVRFGSPPAPGQRDPDTQRGVQPAAAFDERTAASQATALLAASDWSGARQALHALAAKVPQNKAYRALLCYARGREAQSGSRFEEAILEYDRALQLDGELAVAKSARADALKRRR